MQTQVKERPQVQEYPELPPVAKLLYEARQLLAEHWCRNQLADGQGNYCARGAIAHVLGHF